MFPSDPVVQATLTFRSTNQPPQTHQEKYRQSGPCRPGLGEHLHRQPSAGRYLRPFDHGYVWKAVDLWRSS